MVGSTCLINTNGCENITEIQIWNFDLYVVCFSVHDQATTTCTMEDSMYYDVELCLSYTKTVDL